MRHRFIGALTRGGAGGMPRPIEMHAHDPRRFIGDMLAWVHQAGRPPTCSASSRSLPMQALLRMHVHIPPLWAGFSSRTGVL